jgi:hypothetical protein
MAQENAASIIEESRDRIWNGEYRLVPVEFADTSNVNPGDVVYCPTKFSAFVLEVATINEVALSGLLTCLDSTVKMVTDDEGRLTRQPLEALDNAQASFYTNFQSLRTSKGARVAPAEKTGIGPFTTARITKSLQIIRVFEKPAEASAD